MSLKEQLAEYLSGWYKRVPSERQAIMQRHIDQLRSGAIPSTKMKSTPTSPGNSATKRSSSLACFAPRSTGSASPSNRLTC